LNKVNIADIADKINNDVIELVKTMGAYSEIDEIIDGPIRMLLADGRERDAAGLIRKIVKLEWMKKIGASMLMFRAGLINEKIRDYTEAAKCYRESIDLYIAMDQWSYWQHNNLGYCLNYLREFEEAELFCRKAILFCPERHNAWKNLGVALEHQERYTEAMDCYRKAVEICPEDGRSAKHLEELIKEQKEAFERQISS